MLKNELNQIKEENIKLKSLFDEAESSLKVLERKVKEKEWQTIDALSLKDAKINDLEARVHSLETSKKLSSEDINRK